MKNLLTTVKYIATNQLRGMDITAAFPRLNLFFIDFSASDTNKVHIQSTTGIGGQVSIDTDLPFGVYPSFYFSQIYKETNFELFKESKLLLRKLTGAQEEDKLVYSSYKVDNAYDNVLAILIEGDEPYCTTLDAPIAKKTLQYFIDDIAQSISKGQEIFDYRECTASWEKAISMTCQYLSDKLEVPGFEWFTVLAGLNYESADCRGRIVFSREPLTDELIEFEQKKLYLEYPPKQVRKMLEMTDDNYALVVGCGDILGIGKLAADTSHVECRFNGHASWQLLQSQHGEEPETIIKYNNGQYMLEPKQHDTLAKAWHYVNGIFPKADNKEGLVGLIELAERQSKGTILLITDEAKKEADRLCEVGRAMGTCNVDLIKEEHYVPSITCIDGAVILSPDGKCHAIGAILDGIAQKGGDPARGARHNSASTYVSGKNQEKAGYLAIVVSEDGGATFCCNNEDLKRKLEDGNKRFT